MSISVVWVADLPGGVPLAWHVNAEADRVTYYLSRAHPRLAAALAAWGRQTVRALECRGPYAILRVAPAA